MGGRIKSSEGGNVSRAPESPQVKKARRKLKAQMETEKKEFNEYSLRKVKAAMQRWISRHSSHRVRLEDRSISLFDENRHPAKTESKFVKALFEQLRNQAAQQDAQSLRGRVDEKP